MTTLTGQFIFLCWAVFIIYWIVASFGVKRTVERQAGWWRILVLLIAMAIAFFMINHDAILWSYTLTIGIIADIVTLIGLIIMLWARTVLGGNWSTSTVLKENHELIQSGPYRYVRHPIYSGLLLMVLGAAIFYGHAIVFVAFAVSFIIALLRAREEEKLLTRNFPEEYPNYKARVKAFIPFVL
jgi:protein-S-isoprenylcysteine O-methyltransferase Ste14